MFQSALPLIVTHFSRKDKRLTMPQLHQMGTLLVCFNLIYFLFLLLTFFRNHSLINRYHCGLLEFSIIFLVLLNGIEYYFQSDSVFFYISYCISYFFFKYFTIVLVLLKEHERSLLEVFGP